MRKIAIMVENSRAYGRAMIEGIAAFAQDGRDWILRPLSVEEAFTTKLKDFDGVIARIADERLAARLVRAGLPTVDVFCQSVYPGIAGVDSDHDSIGRLARDFFRTRGFRHLAFCGIPGAAFSHRREKAFSDKETHVYAGLLDQPTDESQFFAERVDRIPDKRQLKAWIKSLPRPVAIFCCNDLRAIQLQQVIRECGLRVPADIAILGVDNDTIACSFAEVPISSIDPNSFEVGKAAARLLNAMLAKRPAPKRHKVHSVKPGNLTERTSTEFMPIDPPWLGNALLYIEKNMNRPISAADIFALAERSGTFVETVFKAKLGMPVQAYITSVKMREAKRLLADPRLRISEIGYLCGFSSPAYFCRTFAATFGQSPRSCRPPLLHPQRPELQTQALGQALVTERIRMKPFASDLHLFNARDLPEGPELFARHDLHGLRTRLKNLKCGKEEIRRTDCLRTDRDLRRNERRKV